MAFGGIETGLRALGIPDPSKITSGIEREYGFSPNIEKFGPDTILDLEKRGWFVCTLTGKTPEKILNIRPTGMEINILDEDRELLTLPSKLTQIAFAPIAPFLPKSNNMTLEYQRVYLEYFNSVVQKETPQAKVIMPGVSDIVEAAHAYLVKTRKTIFHKRQGRNYTATSTESEDGLVMNVGGIMSRNCLLSINISHHSPEEPFKDVYLMPMLAPAGLEI